MPSEGLGVIQQSAPFLLKLTHARHARQLVHRGRGLVELLSVREVAARLGVCTSTIYKHCAEDARSRSSSRFRVPAARHVGFTPP
jgi:predicted DNA-binding transcriptional regulator AlpA